jgi:hypothetical protein
MPEISNSGRQACEVLGVVLAATGAMQPMLAAESDTAKDSEAVQTIVAALDQRQVVTARAACTLAVYGVHVDPDGVWLQVGLHDGDDHYLVVHLPYEATAEDALATIQECDFERSEVVEVMRTVQ